MDIYFIFFVCLFLLSISYIDIAQPLEAVIINASNRKLEINISNFFVNFVVYCAALIVFLLSPLFSIIGVKHRVKLAQFKAKKRTYDFDGGGLKYSLEVYRNVFNLANPIEMLLKFVVAICAIFGSVFLNFRITEELGRFVEVKGGQNNILLVVIGIFESANGWQFLLALVTILMVFLSLPIIANIEEILFRAGTHTFFGVLGRSIIFGLVHYSTGMGLVSCIVAIFFGLYFSICFMIGKLKLATQMHFLNNLFTLTFTLCLFLFNHFASLLLR